MVQSMTGYGSHTISSENYKVTVELKSLNSKYIEINMKLPRTYIQHEMTLRNHMTQQLKRGKVNAILDVEVLNPEKQKFRINKDLVKSYAADLKSLHDDLGLTNGVNLEYLLGLPDSIRTDNDGDDPEEWSLIEICFQHATKSLSESRHKEGKALERDLRIRADLIMRQLEQIRERIPARIEAIRSRVLSSLNEIQDRVNIDGNRFEQELIYYIEKLDINEEMVRLKKHLQYFEQTLSEDFSNGKKLGFISQEMGREINTIGSKANDADIQVYVVKMKEELEKIKEQVLNIV